MSLLTENIIPGNHGKIFETNAIEPEDLKRIKTVILNISGIKDVIINENEFPVQITIHTSAIVKVKDVEEAVKTTDFHAIPKAFFEL